MSIYLAGKPEDHVRFEEYARCLQSKGIEVVSTWHRNGEMADLLELLRQRNATQKGSVKVWFGKMMAGETPELNNTGISLPVGFDSKLEDALLRCKEELDLADRVIADLDGGSVEAGYALASGKKLITMGTVRSPLNVAYSENAKAVDDWPEVLIKLHRQAWGAVFARNLDDIAESAS